MLENAATAGDYVACLAPAGDAAGTTLPGVLVGRVRAIDDAGLTIDIILHMINGRAHRPEAGLTLAPPDSGLFLMTRLDGFDERARLAGEARESWLRRLHCDHDVSFSELAAMVGLTTERIRQIWAEHGFPRRHAEINFERKKTEWVCPECNTRMFVLPKWDRPNCGREACIEAARKRPIFYWHKAAGEFYARFIGSSTRVRAARVLMEQHLGRKLDPRNEIPAYRDGNPRNLDINNIEILTLKDARSRLGHPLRAALYTEEEINRCLKAFYSQHGRLPSAVDAQLRLRKGSVEMIGYSAVLRHFGVRSWPEAMKLAARRLGLGRTALAGRKQIWRALPRTDELLALDRFRTTHGNLPQSQDFGRDGMPTRTSIYLVYGAKSVHDLYRLCYYLLNFYTEPVLPTTTWIKRWSVLAKALHAETGTTPALAGSEPMRPDEMRKYFGTTIAAEAQRRVRLAEAYATQPGRAIEAPNDHTIAIAAAARMKDLARLLDRFRTSEARLPDEEDFGNGGLPPIEAMETVFSTENVRQIYRASYYVLRSTVPELRSARWFSRHLAYSTRLSGFRKTHGRLPRNRELGRNGLPTRAQVHRYFGTRSVRKACMKIEEALRYAAFPQRPTTDIIAAVRHAAHFGPAHRKARRARERAACSAR